MKALPAEEKNKTKNGEMNTVFRRSIMNHYSFLSSRNVSNYKLLSFIIFQCPLLVLFL